MSDRRENEGEVWEIKGGVNKSHIHDRTFRDHDP